MLCIQQQGCKANALDFCENLLKSTLLLNSYCHELWICIENEQCFGELLGAEDQSTSTADISNFTIEKSGKKSQTKIRVFIKIIMYLNQIYKKKFEIKIQKNLILLILIFFTFKK